MMHEARNPYIDFLRGFGLLLLVVAHTYSPEWLFQIRTFDVPLMVFVSGMCYKPLRGGVFSIFYKTVQTHLYTCCCFSDIIFRCRNRLSYLVWPSANCPENDSRILSFAQ